MTARPVTLALTTTLTTVALALAACGADDQPDAATTPAPAGTEVSVTIEPESTKPAAPPTLPSATEPGTTPATPATPSIDPTVPDVDDAARAAIDDLAARIGVDPATIKVVADERVTWRDGSIGCPKPGMAYTQALVPGRRLVLSSGGQTYAYHAGRTGPLAYCETPDPEAPAPGGPGTDT